MKTDWDAIANEYITTNATQAQIADKYGLSPSSVGTRATAEHWSQRRKDFKQNVVKTAYKKITNKKAKKLADIALAADRMTKKINQVLADEKQFNRYIVDGIIIDDNGKKIQSKIDAEYKKIDTKSMRDLAAAMRDITAVIRDVNNIPSMQEQRAYDIALERLKMDKERNAVESNTDKTVKVVFESSDSEKYAE